MGVYHLVYTACNLFHLLGRGLGRQLIVYLTLLAFYVCVVGTLASEHPHHGLVQNVLGSVHGRIFRLIVVVQLGFLHRILFIFHAKVAKKS
jgi:hypothetical protein